MTGKKTKGGETVCTDFPAARRIVVTGIYLAQLVFLYITRNNGVLNQAVMPTEVPITWHTKVYNAARYFVVVEKNNRQILRRVFHSQIGQDTREVLLDLDQVQSLAQTLFSVPLQS
jgi:hypothetical protein